MNIKKLIFLFLFSIISLSYSQERQTSAFGHPSPNDLSLKIYEKDTTAAAVVLYEQGYYEFETVGDYIRLIKHIYRKIKVFDAQKFNGGSVDIPLLVSDKSSEKVTGYNALTHNGPIKTYVSADAIFVTSVPQVGKVCRIIFPNIKDGSIIEYAYKIESPFFFNLDGWEFQGSLPKLYSEFVSKIPGNFRYKKAIYGNHQMYFQSSEIEPRCFRPAEHYSAADCVTSVYVMTDVPAFHEEKYMLSSKNYISRIEYEPKEFVGSWGGTSKISNEWKDVDKLYKKGNYIGSQLHKKGFFKRRLPDSILSKTDDLEKAKAIYTFIQNHYTWNGTYYSSETEVKDAFDLKTGSIPEINLSLINALEAANLDVKLMLLSTRQNGLPTALYPVMTKFNYTLAVLKIADETYLLDATDKEAPFGIIPFRTLNVQGRVMDFKNGSYWLPITPYKQNIFYTNANIKAVQNGIFTGEVAQTSSGYIALAKRTDIASSTIENYIKETENDLKGIDITEYQIKEEKEIDKPLKENYAISVEPEIVDDKVFLYPFFNKTYISENPFKLDDRSYPMDFGFPFTNTYLVSIDLGSIYTVENLPESRIIKLPNNDGECSVNYISEGDKVTIRFTLKLSNYRFQPEAYQSLKEFFGTMVTMLKDEPITLKKI